MIGGRVLITGGTGTLGKAILRIAGEQDWPARFTILSRDEMKQAKMRQEFPDAQYVIGDIRDLVGLEKAFAGHDIVIHAAAYKHVPTAEMNAVDVLNINSTGSFNVCLSAIRVGVEKVIGISTDKACRPVNVYGMSKACMEKIFQDFSMRSLTTSFHLVRYGNVVGSTGSVSQVWQQMLDTTGRIQVTDPDMSRFWLTENEAVDLILDGLDVESGSILIPMLPSMYLKDMVSALFGDVSVNYTGLRPGEKRHEDLLAWEEAPWATVHDDPPHFIVKPMWHSTDGLGANRNYYSIEAIRQVTPEEMREMVGKE